MNKTLLALLMGCSTFFLKAQITFVKGYLINEKGDTLKGEVKINPKKEHENYNKVFFKDASGIQKNYKPNAKVKGYGFENNDFVTMTQDDETKFYKRLTKGEIEFYKVAFEAINMNETTFDYDYFLFKAGDKKMTNVKQNKFKKQIQEWMTGSAGFANDFKDEKNFNEASAIDVINKYNEWKKTN
jgi:hypothetical protein